MLEPLRGGAGRRLAEFVQDGRTLCLAFAALRAVVHARLASSPLGRKLWAPMLFLQAPLWAVHWWDSGCQGGLRHKVEQGLFLTALDVLAGLSLVILMKTGTRRLSSVKRAAMLLGGAAGLCPQVFIWYRGGQVWNACGAAAMPPASS